MDRAIESAALNVAKAQRELKTAEVAERATQVLLTIAEDQYAPQSSRVEAAKVLLTVADIRMAGGSFGR